MLHNGRDAVLEGLVQFVQVTCLNWVPDYVVDYLVAPDINFFLGVPYIALGVVVLLNPKAVVDRLD